MLGLRGALVDVRTSQPVAVGAVATPGPPFDSVVPPFDDRPPKWEAPPSPGGPALRAGRTPAWAYVLAIVVVLSVVGAVIFGWAACTRPSYPVPGAMRGYANGQGDIYTTKTFTVRLPYHFATTTVQVPVASKSISMNIAAARQGDTIVAVAAGRMGSRPESPTASRAVFNTLFAQVVKDGAGTATTRAVKTSYGEGFEFSGKLASTNLLSAGRIMFIGNQVVIFVVVSKQAAGGVLHALVESYQKT